jgi:oligoribonuclease NrnB/cAMP/cGMP phosphodiesterase (DHH superfamily)
MESNTNESDTDQIEPVAQLQYFKKYVPKDKTNNSDSVIQSPDLVIYHKNCPDGICSAAIVYLLNHKRNVYYLPLNHGDNLDFELLKNKKVLILDFSFKKDIFKKIIETASDVFIIDHHLTAKEELLSHEESFSDYCHIDMTHSGAYLTYSILHPSEYDNVPKFVKLVEDRDIWKWKYRSEAEPLYLAMKKKKYKDHIEEIKFYSTCITDENIVAGLITSGRVLYEKNQEQIREVSKKAVKVNATIDNRNYKVMVLHLVGPSLVSEIAEYLYTNNHDIDFTVCFFRTKRGTSFFGLFNRYDYVFSFRSNKMDVSKIAKYYGGGGHKFAAGANLDYVPSYMLASFSFKHRLLYYSFMIRRCSLMMNQYLHKCYTIVVTPRVIWEPSVPSKKE